GPEHHQFGGTMRNDDRLAEVFETEGPLGWQVTHSFAFIQAHDLGGEAIHSSNSFRDITFATMPKLSGGAAVGHFMRGRSRPANGLAHVWAMVSDWLNDGI